MKKTIKFIIVLVLSTSALFYSCETVELELTENPNNLLPELADADLLLNSIQSAYNTSMTVFHDQGSDLVRIDYLNGRDYFAAKTGLTLNGNWNRAYSNIFVNMRLIEELNLDPTVDLNFNEGVAKTLSAHTLMLLVDFLGDIPFSEALNPEEFPNPGIDDDADVYQSALTLLDEAAALLSGEVAVSPGVNDLFYNEDSEAWLRLVNTLRLRAALTTGDITTFNSIIAAGNFISSTDQDFEFQYGTNLLNPDNRHQDYINDYTTAGANIFQSNWLMNYMDTNNDPRIRYYFYRQSECTPGASCNTLGDGQTLSCSLETAPAHYTVGGFTFCFLENGYWGRDHGDDDGVGPDNFLRTASGVYPAGGLFDQDLFGGVGVGLGGGGAGIEPIMLASYVDFMRAEVALASGDAPGASAFIQAGLEKSIAKVQSFGSLDITNDGTLEPDAATVTAFIDGQISAFDAGSTEDQWNILAQQLWVTQFGSGADAYNFYRRRGFPNTLQPNLEPNPGGFVRSFPYPNVEVIANPNLSQKANQAVQVFWDTNPPSAVSGGFPASN